MIENEKDEAVEPEPIEPEPAVPPAAAEPVPPAPYDEDGPAFVEKADQDPEVDL